MDACWFQHLTDSYYIAPGETSTVTGGTVIIAGSAPTQFCPDVGSEVVPGHGIHPTTDTIIDMKRCLASYVDYILFVRQAGPRTNSALLYSRKGATAQSHAYSRIDETSARHASRRLCVQSRSTSVRKCIEVKEKLINVGNLPTQVHRSTRSCECSMHPKANQDIPCKSRRRNPPSSVDFHTDKRSRLAGISLAHSTKTASLSLSPIGFEYVSDN